MCGTSAQAAASAAMHDGQRHSAHRQLDASRHSSGGTVKRSAAEAPAVQHAPGLPMHLPQHSSVSRETVCCSCALACAAWWGESGSS